MRDAGGNLHARMVGNERDFFRRLDAQAGVHSAFRTGRELRIEFDLGDIGQNGLGQATPFLASYELHPFDYSTAAMPPSPASRRHASPRRYSRQPSSDRPFLHRP